MSMTRAEFEAEISIPYMKAMKMMANAPKVDQQHAPTADATPEAAPSQAEANIGPHHVNHAVIAVRIKDDMNTVYDMILSATKKVSRRWWRWRSHIYSGRFGLLHGKERRLFYQLADSHFWRIWTLVGFRFGLRQGRKLDIAVIGKDAL